MKLLSLAIPAMMVGCAKDDPFGDELVCIHIFPRGADIPEPLLAHTGDAPIRKKRDSLFGIGLPELILATTTKPMLDLFQYFWPFTRQDLKALQTNVAVNFQSEILSTKTDRAALSQQMAQFSRAVEIQNKNKVVIFTLNDSTRYWSLDLVEFCRAYDVDELVVFKDPSRPPYLCSYPARQKGFKKPPPIG